MINELTTSRQIQRARTRYLAAMEKQSRALAEIPARLDQHARLVAIDRILRDCSQALCALAKQLPSREQTKALDPDLRAEIEEFRDSIDVVRKTITPSRLEILADIAALQPAQN